MRLLFYISHFGLGLDAKALGRLLRSRKTKDRNSTKTDYMKILVSNFFSEFLNNTTPSGARLVNDYYANYVWYIMKSSFNF